MVDTVTGAARSGTATYAVLGDPVAHSLSPAIHNAAFRAAGRDALYVARRVPGEECGPVLRALALGGGGGNVTVPHKERVLPFLDRTTEAVAATGACNAFWAEDGEVWGDNTDVEGFLGTWEGAVAGLREAVDVLVLGAGGAAKAVVWGLLESSGAARISPGRERPPRRPKLATRGGARFMGMPGGSCPRVASVLVWNRTGGRASELVRRFGDARVSRLREWREAAPAVLVNATPVGLGGRRAPLDLRALRTPPRRVIDLVYGKEPTPLCRQAAGMGIAAVDGRDMLVRQAEASYLRWFGEPPPRGVMRRALG